MNELFEIPVSLSPKLKWLRRHNLEIEHRPHIPAEGAECPETGDTVYPWICRLRKSSGLYFDNQIGSGGTEEEAIIAYCQNSGAPHYSVENNT